MEHVLYFIFFLATNVVQSISPNCPSNYGYDVDLNVCLLYLDQAETWDNAWTACKEHDGDLISIHNAFQNALVAQNLYNMTGESKSWLGAHGDGNGIAGNWTWTDQTPFDYQRFFGATERGECVYLDRDDLMWKVTSCSRQFKFLCVALSSPTTETTPEYTIPTSPSSLNCLPPDQQPEYNCYQGWQYYSGTGYQYLVAFDRNFTDGENFCVSQGGHLASIHSSDENEFIRGLCCVSGCFNDHADVYLATYLVGGHRVAGNFTWLDGTPFDYKHDFCDDDGAEGDNLMVLNFDCNNCPPGIWYTARNEISAILPYIVCKKK